jgi:Cu/Ag efflux protein CusF
MTIRAQAYSVKRSAWWIGAAACLSIFIAPVVLTGTATPVLAQASGMVGAGTSETISMQATVKSVDQKKRKVTLVGPNGDEMKLKVGKDVQNLEQLKAGDVVVVQYTEAVAFVIAPAGTKTPDDMVALAEERAAPGEKPGGAMEGMVVVTGLVVAVNPGANTISLVNPEGGEVIKVSVKDPEYLRMLPSVKVGDTVTAVISEGIVVAVAPAK